MRNSSIGQSHRFYFLLAICLLLGSTNATNTTATTTTTDTNVTGMFGKLASNFQRMWKNFNSDSAGNLTTNESLNASDTTIFHTPKTAHDFQQLLTAFVRFLAQLLLIFGGILPYIPQYLIIKRTQNAEGFSNYVCLTLFVANIIRIEFWFGKHFETPLLLQSIVMIICMLVMLEIWTRVHCKTMRQKFQTASDEQNISGSKEQLTEEVYVKKLTDFEVDFFWRWTKFTSYLQFLCIITLIMSIITWVFLKNVVYIETIGFLAVFCEACLGMPQFLRNFRLKSTEGMSVKMVLLWASGDIFKTVYFILRNAPKQFWFCGILQISIDFAILAQVIIYSNKYHFFGEQQLA